MKTSIKKTLLSILLATLWLVIIALLNLVKIGEVSLAYRFSMAVLGFVSGWNIAKLTEKIFKKFEKRKKDAQLKFYPMKTEKLCNECEYGFFNNCCNICKCSECEMKANPKCLCLTIKAGDPCPYFKKYEEKEGADE